MFLLSFYNNILTVVRKFLYMRSYFYQVVRNVDDVMCPERIREYRYEYAAHFDMIHLELLTNPYLIFWFKYFDYQLLIK